MGLLLVTGVSRGDGIGFRTVLAPSTFACGGLLLKSLSLHYVVTLCEIVHRNSFQFIMWKSGSTSLAILKLLICIFTLTHNVNKFNAGKRISFALKQHDIPLVWIWTSLQVFLGGSFLTRGLVIFGLIDLVKIDLVKMPCFACGVVWVNIFTRHGTVGDNFVKMECIHFQGVRVYQEL